MNLSDKEILELTELCNAVVDGTVTEKQKTRLASWLAAAEEARRFYVRAVALSASLCSYASELQTEEAHAPSPSSKLLRPALGWWFGSIALAASVVFALWIERPVKRQEAPDTRKADEYVARLTGSKDCRWANTAAAIRPGDCLRAGQRLELAAGFAEVTFDSGAMVVLEGPASLEINSAWVASLSRGTLKANVPREAIGFRIANPAVEVVDLGTEFTMIADASGAADVLVLKGEVEASPGHAGDQILLRENQSRHFDPSGVSSEEDGQKFARLALPVSLDHFAPATGYVHWSFDEEGGNVLKADAFGVPLSAFDGRLREVSPNAPAADRTEGRWARALQFNGRLYAKAPFPGLSGVSPRTIVFWVKVPDDAHLSSAYAMVAWSANSKKLGSHPVHVGWNRNPSEGTVGVLRTDYGGGFALGATPLRDGRWHHVAVVFVPGADANTPVEVKQYVDGRLEGEGKPSPPGTEVSTKVNTDNPQSVADTLWLGCRIGINGPRKDRFRGEMDELCVADRALGPREIVTLMKDNKPPSMELAARP